MKTLVVLFNLKPGVSEADYEEFAKSLDIPTVKKLRSVSDFRVLKSAGLFGAEGTPPYQYFEIIDFSGIDELLADMGAEPLMAEIPGKFQALADNPIFILTDSI
jgi:REDY-like protein HapK